MQRDLSAAFAPSTGAPPTSAPVQVFDGDRTHRRDPHLWDGEREAYARGLFEHSPLPLRVEDFSAVRRLFDALRAEGVGDLEAHIARHPDFVPACMAAIRVLDANRRTLATFGAPDLPTLLAAPGARLRGDPAAFAEELVGLWGGRLVQNREISSRAPDGEELHFVKHLAVLPGCEKDWSLVQVALTDITARKKAEAHLEYLGTHDILTSLSNRAFFLGRMRELETREVDPLTVMMIDLNGLKEINDDRGHAAGDDILRRAGEVIVEAVPPAATAARIGGDEFAVLMPEIGESEGRTRAETLLELAELANRLHPGERLSLSVGVAARRAPERLEETLRRADERMYAAKREHYAALGPQRRRPRAPAAA